MNRTSALGLVLVLAAFAPAQPSSLIPRPKKMTMQEGTFELTLDVTIQAQAGLDFALRLASILQRSTGYAVPVQKLGDTPPPGSIVLRMKRGEESLRQLGPEGYRLVVRRKNVFIESAAPAGCFYGCQTLRQLLPPLIDSATVAKGATWTIPCLEIEDSPRYGWRGLMIDSCRHFQPKAHILRMIDLCAYYKLNRFHWHLTEDEGWRLEIKKYPKLTSIGAWRGDGNYRHGGFYTQKDVKEIVAYAKERFVTVVPEIELPGHCMAALVAYPELSCRGEPYEVGKGGLRHFRAWSKREAYCAGKEGTFKFLEDVLTETLELFPSTFIHIGGDERPRNAWQACEHCQARIKKEGLKDENELQSWFIKRIEQFLNARQRRLVGWDEILEGGLAPNATVMSWRGTIGGIKAAKMGHDVVMSPTSHCYLDYWQGDPEWEPAGRAFALTTKVVYSYDPRPATLSDAEAKHILGAQGNVWTEFIKHTDVVEYMTFPRLCALAEVVWTPQEMRQWPEFEKRLGLHYAHLSALGVHFRIPPPEGMQSRNLFVGETELELRTSIPGARIRYTRGKRLPNPDATLYTKPIKVRNDSVITARVFLPDGRGGTPVTGTFTKTDYLEPDKGGKFKAGLELAYYEGVFRHTSHVARGEPVRTGTVPGLELPIDRKGSNFGITLRGHIVIPDDAIYTFQIRSDDGSRLTISDHLVVDNDGTHGPRTARGQVALKGGVHPIELRYFQRGGPHALAVKWSGPGFEMKSIPKDSLMHREK